MSVEGVGGSLSVMFSRVYQNSGVEQPQWVPAKGSQETEDIFELSDAGQKALELPSLFGTRPGEPITLWDIQNWAGKELGQFDSKFKEMLAKNGIDTSEPITLGHEYGTGRVIVKNEHPQAKEIE